MKAPTKSDNLIMAAWQKSPGFVYFLKGGNAIKIGVAAVPTGKSMAQAIQRRFNQIQSSNHERLELLGVIRFQEGERPTLLAEKRERELHIQFESSLRFKMHSLAAEWFNSSDELLEFVRNNTESPEVLGVPPLIS
ncbi:hypothetical protein JQ600_02505 [Bradyrhizobium sp. AUGA SZCCT0176]|uniref:hypothetical protein n=1 Tax=Bradyrhizobium sp. AUGA SZCCT0176 TaxID=2807664 RepID=UPI001BA8E3BD|nr:hypothetical protein [Bradyrhizobium sp. AUGA SZCCT0176]MBR1223769.1 hypothetical protein [Bradyrhizobium sp. AUGA SZCCT0176]